MTRTYPGRPKAEPTPEVERMVARMKREGWVKERTLPRWLRFVKRFPQEPGVTRHVVLFAQPIETWHSRRRDRAGWALDGEARGPAGDQPLLGSPRPIPDVRRLSEVLVALGPDAIPYRGAPETTRQPARLEGL